MNPAHAVWDWVRAAIAVLFAAARHYGRDRASQHAAAVAYYALLALAPSLYLLGRLIRAVLPTARGTEAIVDGVAPYLPPQAGQVLRPVVESLPRGTAIVAFAVPALLILASTAFGALEIAINNAFGTVPKMRFWLSRLKSFAGLSILGLLLISTLVLNQAVAWIVENQRRLGIPPVLGARASWISYLATLGVTYISFVLLYKALPRGRVAWSAAGWAAGVAVLLWEIARHIYGGMLGRSPAFGLLTGVLAGTVAFLLWVFTAVAVVIYGAEVAAVLNGHRPGPPPRGDRPRPAHS